VSVPHVVDEHTDDAAADGAIEGEGGRGEGAPHRDGQGEGAGLR